jgi:adenylylsulfate kinase
VLSNIQVGACYWLTGLPGSGKTTLAQEFHRRLRSAGHDACVLDADLLREGLNCDLGFSAEVAHLFVLEGFISIVSSIAPYKADRDRVRQRFLDGSYFEVFVDAPIEVCIARDPKGLYQKARLGTVAQVTGVSAPYERPRHPDITLKTNECQVEACVEALLCHHGRLAAQPGGAEGSIGAAIHLS